MKKEFTLLFLFVSFLFPAQIYSQCFSTIDTTITPTTCLNNGSVTINAVAWSSSPNVSYTIMNPFPLNFTNNSPYIGLSGNPITIGAMSFGNYTILIKNDTICDSTITVNIGNNYTQMDANYIPSITASTSCKNGIISGTIGGGASPFMYKIKFGSAFIDSNNNGTFVGLAPGYYTVIVTDSCGASRTNDSCFVDSLCWKIIKGFAHKNNCGQYTLDSVTFDSIPSILRYLIKHDTTVLDSSSTLPLPFLIPDNVISNVKVCVKDTSNCEKCEKVTITNNWSINAALVDYPNCDSFRIASITFTDSINPIPPLTYGFINHFGTINADTIWFPANTTIPHKFYQLPYPDYGKVIVKDACGVMQATIDPTYMKITMAPINHVITFINCDSSNLTIAVNQPYITPLTYYLNNSTIPSTVNTFTNLPDGTYSVTVVDACTSSTSSNIALSHKWKSYGNSIAQCSDTLFDHTIWMVRRMKPLIKIIQWNQNYTIKIDSASYTNPNIFTSSSGMSVPFDTRKFYNTLPNYTYHYIIKDSCNRVDTVTLTNPPYNLLPDTLNATSEMLCHNKGKIHINYHYQGPKIYPLSFKLTKLNPMIIKDSIVKIDSIGSFTWGSIPSMLIDTGTYVVEMKPVGNGCNIVIRDTVIITPYTLIQITVPTPIYLPPAPYDTIKVVVNVSGGIPPYLYQITQTIPIGAETAPTLNNTFLILDTFAQPINFIQVRVTDKCGTSEIYNIDSSVQFIVLPIHALIAEASLAGNITLFKWQTLDERNVEYFSLQRSNDGIHFLTYAERSALGNTFGLTNYEIENDISNWMSYPSIYYRVIAHDLDGNETYSNIVQIKPIFGAAVVEVFPTPFTNSIHIRYLNSSNSKISIQLFDINQRLITSKTMHTKAGNHLISLDDLSYLPDAIYMLQITDKQNGNKYIHKIIKGK